MTDGERERFYHVIWIGLLWFSISAGMWWAIPPRNIGEYVELVIVAASATFIVIAIPYTVYHYVKDD